MTEYVNLHLLLSTLLFCSSCGLRYHFPLIYFCSVFHDELYSISTDSFTFDLHPSALNLHHSFTALFRETCTNFLQLLCKSVWFLLMMTDWAELTIQLEGQIFSREYKLNESGWINSLSWPAVWTSLHGYLTVPEILDQTDLHLNFICISSYLNPSSDFFCVSCSSQKMWYRVMN